MNSLQIRAAGLQRTTNEAAPPADVDAVADYVLTSGTKCGPQTITGKYLTSLYLDKIEMILSIGWTEKYDYIRLKDAQIVDGTKMFAASTGLMTPPKAGYYHICAYSSYVLNK